jgi:hypothetical protein
LSLTKDVKSRLIDSQEQEQERVRSVQLQSSSYGRIKSSCCFGGGGQSSTSRAGEEAMARATKAPKSPARSVKSAKSAQD